MTIRKRGRIFWYDFMIDRQRYRGALRKCRTIAEARREEAQLKVAVYDGTYRTDTGWAFKRFVEEVYLPWSKVNKRSYQSDSWRSKVLVGFFGSRLLSEITPPLIEQFKSRRKSETTTHATKRSATSVNRELELLSHIFTLAQDHGLITENPCRRVRKFKLDNRRERVMSVEEEQRLLQALSSPRRSYLRAMVIVALHTGMRRGEIGLLKWRDVDFVRGQIYVRRIKTGKNGYVPMNRTIRELLGSLPRAAGDEETTLFEVKWIESAWRKVCAEVEIKDLRFHDLRHTFATRLLQAGASLQIVRDFLGHTSASTTLRYTHSSTDEMCDAVAALDKKPRTSLSQKLSQLAG